MLRTGGQTAQHVLLVFTSDFYLFFRLLCFPTSLFPWASNVKSALRYAEQRVLGFSNYPDKPARICQSQPTNIETPMLSTTFMQANFDTVSVSDGYICISIYPAQPKMKTYSIFRKCVHNIFILRYVQKSCFIEKSIFDEKSTDKSCI